MQSHPVWQPSAQRSPDSEEEDDDPEDSAPDSEPVTAEVLESPVSEVGIWVVTVSSGPELDPVVPEVDPVVLSMMPLDSAELVVDDVLLSVSVPRPVSPSTKDPQLALTARAIHKPALRPFTNPPHCPATTRRDAIECRPPCAHTDGACSSLLGGGWMRGIVSRARRCVCR